MEEWMEDDNKLEKWESRSLTASDRRILHWLAKAVKKTLQEISKGIFFCKLALSLLLTNAAMTC